MEHRVIPSLSQVPSGIGQLPPLLTLVKEPTLYNRAGSSKQISVQQGGEVEMSHFQYVHEKLFPAEEVSSPPCLKSIYYTK